MGFLRFPQLILFVGMSLLLSACLDKRPDLLGKRSPASQPHSPLDAFTHVPNSSAHWDVVYHGWGTVDFSPESIRFAPAAALSLDTTHAVLLSLNPEVHPSMNHFRIRIQFETRAHTRVHTANDWEVFWLMFNMLFSEGHFLSSNYLIQKPQTGLELGRAWTVDEQHFLATDASHPLAIQESMIWELENTSDGLKLYRLDKIDDEHGELLMHFSDDSSDPEQYLFHDKGALGLYSEDAEVWVYDFYYQNLDPSLP